MTINIEELRWYADKIAAYGDYAKGAAGLMISAADEIERLRAEAQTQTQGERFFADTKHYGHFQPRGLEPHFSQHMDAMTEEGLHEKGDIACELAWRDKEDESAERSFSSACVTWGDYFAKAIRARGEHQ